MPEPAESHLGPEIRFQYARPQHPYCPSIPPGPSPVPWLALSA